MCDVLMSDTTRNINESTIVDCRRTSPPSGKRHTVVRAGEKQATVEQLGVEHSQKNVRGHCYDHPLDHC